MAAALDRLMGDADLRRSFGCAAKSIRDRYSLQRVAEMWESVLQDILAQRRRLLGSPAESGHAPQRRRVLFLIPTLAGGGAERVAVTLLNHLDRSKFDLSLAVLDTRGAVFLDQLPPDVTFLDLRASRVRYALPKIVRVIRQAQPHVVFSTLGHLNLALSIVRPFLPRQTAYVARETAIVRSPEAP